MKSFQVQHINAGYENRTVVHDISFQAEPGSITGIAGPNGSGKSTLLKSLCCILPHQGTCGFEQPFERLEEKQLARLCSYLPQKSGITLNLTVLDVVMMAYNPVLGLFSSPSPDMAQRAVRVLEEVGLNGKEHTGFLCLSGGEKQLCLLARALVLNTPLLVMDEPENSLDPSFRMQIMQTVKKRVLENGTAAVISLHDINLALHFCDRILLLKDGRLSSVLNPAEDTEKEMELKLSQIFGNVCVRHITDSTGSVRLVMISEFS